MPWYIIIYFSLYILLGIAGILDDFSKTNSFRGIPKWRKVTNIAYELIITFLFITYWHPELLPNNNMLILSLRILFSLAIIWEVSALCSDLFVYPTSENSADEQRFLSAKIITICIVTVTSLPIILVGGIAIFK